MTDKHQCGDLLLLTAGVSGVQFDCMINSSHEHLDIQTSRTKTWLNSEKIS